MTELKRPGISPREIAVDWGFQSARPRSIHEAGAQANLHSRPPRATPSAPKHRLARDRTGTEGRISHLKRRYGLDRSRLKGAESQQIWTEWAIPADDVDTLAPVQ